MSKVLYVEKDKTVFNLRKALCCTLFAAEIVIALLFFSGVAKILGVTVNLWSSIDLILGIFQGLGSTGISFYNRAFSLLLGGAYIFAFVVMIKNIISSFSYVTDAFSTKNSITELDIERDNKLLYLMGCFGENFFYAFLYMTVCRLLWSYDLGSTAIICLIFGSTIYAASRFTYSLLRTRELYSSLLNIAEYMILPISVTLFSIFNASTTLMNLFNGISNTARYLFSKNVTSRDLIYNLYTFICQPAFSIILTVMALKLMYDMFCYLNTRKIQCISTTTILKFTIIFSVIGCVAMGYKSGISSLSGIFSILAPNISVVMLGVASRLVFTFPNSQDIGKYVSAKKENNSNSSTTYPLAISVGTTDIPEHAYENNSIISSVYIPNSVTHIGKGAFSGCGALSDIYCESIAQPATWDIDWLEGCYATIHWGYKQS